MQQVTSDVEAFARIRVVGVGGSGRNAVNHMVESKVKGVEFIVINTDAQDLHHSAAKKKIHIGKNLTRGLGAGGDGDIGKRAAEETKEEIIENLKGSDMVFITCGMGGGTGTGASPVVARAAREMGALTVGVVTRPFSFEGQQRARIADQGLEELRKEVDALIVIPNDRLLAAVDQDTTVSSAFAMCDDILKQAVEGISDLITMPGIINVDFADIRSVMENAGSALMGIGTATGEKRAQEAAQMAINSPLLDISISGAKGVLFSISGGDDLAMLEIQEAASVITESIDQNARVIFGAVRDNRLKKNEIRVTVIATGFPEAATGMGGFQQRSAPLFQSASKEKEQEEEKEGVLGGKIFNSIGGSEKDETPAAPGATAKSEEKTENKEKQVIDATDDSDEWGAVPAFLRRSKIK